MKTYRVFVRLEAEYFDIEAENEDDAFEIASDMAMDGGDWEWDCEEWNEDSND